MKNKLLALVKTVAPALGGAGAYLALGTDLLTGLGLPIWAVKLVAVLLGMGGLGPWLKWILARILSDNNLERWNQWAGGYVFLLFEGVGIVITGGMSRFKLTGHLWNSTLEPWLKVFIKGLVAPLSQALPGLFKGLESDNKPSG